MSEFSVHSDDTLVAVPPDLLLVDDFLTAQAAPLTSPRTCEPGPGTLTIVDTLNTLSIANEQITPSAAATGQGDPRIVEIVGRTRIAGRAFIHLTKQNSAFGADVNKTISPLVGWSVINNPSSGASLYGFYYDSVANTWLLADRSTAGPTSGTVIGCAANLFNKIAHILRSTGAFHFIDNVLLWVSVSGTETPLYPAILVSAANRYNFNCKSFVVRDFGGAFASDYGIATLHQAAPALATSYAADANGIFDLTLTIENPLISTLEFSYRWLTDNDRWFVRANTSGSIQLFSVVNGVPTAQITVAGVFTAGQTYTIRVIADGTKHNLYTLSGATWTKRGSEINIATATIDTLKVLQVATGGTHTVSQLDSFPRRSVLYSVLSN